MQPADGRLGVLTVGLGAVASTLIAGVELVKRGMAVPVGSLALMGTIRLGKRTDNRSPLIKDFVPIADLDDIVFGAWDPFPDDGVRRRSAGRRAHSGATSRASPKRSATCSDAAAFDRSYATAHRRRQRDGHRDKRTMLNAIREDINRFRDEKKVDRLVMLWAASTEIFIEPGPAHVSLDAFEAAIDANDPTIAPSMLYAYAALQEGVPFANGAPNLTVDIAAMREYATAHNVPISGKDFKTGQTLIKTVIGPMLKARMLGLSVGTREHPRQPRRQVLDDPATSRPRRSRSSACSNTSSMPTSSPSCTGDVYHKAASTTTPTRRQQGGWDNIALFGWPATRCSSRSTSCARLDPRRTARARPCCSPTSPNGRGCGIQEWLALLRPQVAPGLYPEHDLFIQLTKFKTPAVDVGEDDHAPRPRVLRRLLL